MKPFSQAAFPTHRHLTGRDGVSPSVTNPTPPGRLWAIVDWLYPITNASSCSQQTRRRGSNLPLMPQLSTINLCCFPIAPAGQMKVATGDQREPVDNVPKRNTAPAGRMKQRAFHATCPGGIAACSRLAERGTSDTTGHPFPSIQAPRQGVPAPYNSYTGTWLLRFHCLS